MTFEQWKNENTELLPAQHQCAEKTKKNHLGARCDRMSWYTLKKKPACKYHLMAAYRARNKVGASGASS